MAWKWFNDKAACDEVHELKANIGHLPAVPEPVKEVYQALPDVSGSVLCFGCTGYIGEAVVFDAVRRNLKVTVFIRQHSVERFTGALKELKIQDRVTFEWAMSQISLMLRRPCKTQRLSAASPSSLRPKLQMSRASTI
jgi:hypothetical protein